MVNILRNLNATNSQSQGSVAQGVSPPYIDAPREATYGTGIEGNRIYAITSFLEQKHSVEVVTGIIKVFSHNVYALLDPRDFLTPYVSNKFDVLPDKLCEPSCVYTHFGESILVEWRYCYCVIFINHKDTMANLIELNMMIYSESLLREKVIVIDIFPDIRPISISPYGMEPSKLKELKDQFVEFLGYIVFGEGIKVDTQKLEVVENRPRPTSPDNIRSFLGLDGYKYKKSDF
ncbi:uncharacterized protein [Solanum lycopersicum]|uniref:uncharacterized protein n=1 Tax=Solanum lycopersicum TaxID=4081 RepID=UPI003747CFA3